MTEIRVRLVGVERDQEEWADMIGCNGGLTAGEGRNTVTFFPEGRCDWLTVHVAERVEEQDLIKIRTKLGNTFTFKRLT